MKRIVLGDREFELFIPHSEIAAAIAALGERINRDYGGRETPLFLGVLNGAFMFMAELLQCIDFQCEVSFIKLASYAGTGRSGEMTELIGLGGNLRGRHIIIVEDVVDSGESIDHLMRSLRGHGPASVEVASLLFKPDAYKKDIPVKYAGISVPADFIIGFGLDYDQLGRNLKDIYRVVEEK